MNTTSTSINTTHPSLEELAAYREGVLLEARAESLRSHLVDCDACAELILELADSEAEAPEVELSEFQRAAAWRRQRERLVEASVLPPATPRPVETSAPLPVARRWWRASSPIWGWAAAVLVTFVSTLSITSLRDQIQRLEEPQLDPSLVNLEPLGAVREMKASAATLELPTETSRGWVILYPAPAEDYPTYRIELRGEQQHLRILDRVPRSPTGNFRLEVSRRLLTPGPCTIVLFGLRAEQAEKLDEFHLNVTY